MNWESWCWGFAAGMWAAILIRDLGAYVLRRRKK